MPLREDKVIRINVFAIDFKNAFVDANTKPF